MATDDSDLAIMDFLNQVAAQSYEDQSERFRSLISKDNSYLALFTSLVKMPRATAKKHQFTLCLI